MIAFLFIFVGIIVALEMLYFYRRISKTIQSFGKIPGKRTKITLISLLCVLGVFCLDISGIVTIAVLHLTAICLIFQLAGFLVSKIAGKKYESGFKLWKRICGGTLIPIIITLAIVIGGYINLNNVVRTDYTVKTDKNIREEGYRIALIADVHYGVSLDREELIEKCAQISECDVDVVILCGDIVDDGTGREDMAAVFAAFGSIKSRYGIFYVYGNHDRNMMSLDYQFTNEELVAEIEKNNITILRDETYSVTDDLVLVGREDRSISRRAGERKSIESLLSSVDQNDFILTLDHQPVEYEENAIAGTDLLLSGKSEKDQDELRNLKIEIIVLGFAVGQPAAMSCIP